MLKRVLVLSMFIFLFCLRGAWAQEPPENNSCVTCHSDMWSDVKGSVHSKNGIFCQNCHGGDPTKADEESAHATAAGFKGVPDKKQIAEICGTCHADVEMMNAYGIRTDQLARYKTSMHGKQLFGANNTKVAVCTDCHGYHDVLNVGDPNSPVYPLNVPKTCNHCHGNEKLMAPYHLPTDMFEKYKNSVHGKALFEKKDLSVANCVSCHGSHGAVPPGVKDIGATCGKCHINEKNNFMESVHANVMGNGKFSECMSCHSNHDIQPASIDLYQQACSKCHAPNSQAFQEGQRIQTVISKAENELKEAREIVKQAGIEGIFVEEDQALLEEAKTKVVEMLPLQHTLSYDKLDDLYKQSAERTTAIRADIKAKRDGLKWRKVALIPIWIFVFVMAWAFIEKYKHLKDKK